MRRPIAAVAMFAAALASAAAVAPPPATTSPLRTEAVAPGRGDLATHWILYLDGEFDAAAAERLESLVAAQHIERAVVYFNSPGGSLVAAMKLGRVVRQHGFTTRVGRRDTDLHRPGPGVCYSACPFAFAGGVDRGVDEGSAMGVHLARNRVPVPDEAAFQARVTTEARDYLDEMGVGTALVAFMLQAPHEQIRLLTPEELARLQLVYSPTKPFQSISSGSGAAQAYFRP